MLIINWATLPPFNCKITEIQEQRSLLAQHFTYSLVQNTSSIDIYWWTHKSSKEIPQHSEKLTNRGRPERCMVGNLGTQKAKAGKQPQVPGHTATEWESETLSQNKQKWQNRSWWKFSGFLYNPCQLFIVKMITTKAVQRMGRLVS